MYCETCRVVFTGDVCPVCGSSKTREAWPCDLCFLTEKEYIWGRMLTDVLQQNEIPFLAENSMGAGMALRVGLGIERIRFYVPYHRLQEARELVEQLFPAQEEAP
jgi:hypothetical protein